VFRPTGFADLAGKRVGLFGYGVEGRAAARRLATVSADVVVVDDDARDGALATLDGGLAALTHCDVVLKSPGIPRRREDVRALEDAGVVVTSALNLWLHEVDPRRVIAVTGTKGKSTTTSLIAFFLRCLGLEAHELGNIGRPPYDVDLDLTSGWLVLEVSSFQAIDITRAPSIIVVTSLGADHLDWHGSLEQYQADKLSLTRAPGDHVTLIPAGTQFDHVESLLGGERRVVERDDTGLANALGLLGAHNDANVALALAACAQATQRPVHTIRQAVAARAHDFVALRGRLTLVASRDLGGGQRVRFVDDGLATAPLPTVAALEVFALEPVALIAGGFDRGVDYAPLASALSTRAGPTTVVTLGPAGERLGASLDVTSNVTVLHAVDMAGAVRAANDALPSGGVVLFSPAAPSFDAYKNWAERSEDFTRYALELSR
jgi:UDP-N-acetylmuramoylalanine--D-glutamate ligase